MRMPTGGARLALVALLRRRPARGACWRVGCAAPEYSLSIVEGETTQPEHSVIATAGSVEPEASVAVSIVRGGIEVSRSSGNDGAWMASIPAPGDVVSLESPTGLNGHPGGKIVGSFVYDGQPSIDPTVCTGSANFSGQRSTGQTIQGGYFLDMVGPYGGFERGNPRQAQITLLSRVDLRRQLPDSAGVRGDGVGKRVAGNAARRRSRLHLRKRKRAARGRLSRPPPPPPPPPRPPALPGSILKLARTTIHKLLKSGWLDQVTINQPGTVIQDLYLQDGKLPAFAAGNRGKHHARKVPPAQLVARGSTTATHPGTVNVLIRVTARGRRLLRHRSQARLVLVTTLRSTSGAKLNLARRTVSLHR